MRRVFRAASGSAFLLATVIPATGFAQTVNYGELEQLLGEPITTSATGKPQKVSDVPANMEIVTQDDIRRSGADNIPDLLQYLTGIDFRRSSFNDPELAVRGYDQPWNPRLLVLVNGQPVYEDFFGDVIWPAIPVQLDEIRQIEVVRGPNSALFGFNAASGVINIVTYDPMRDPVNVVTVRAGNLAVREGSVVATLQSPDQYGIRLSAASTHADEYRITNVPPSNTVGLLKPQSENANFDARWQMTDEIVWAVNGNTDSMKRNFPPDGQLESDRTHSLRSRLTASTPIGTTDLDAYWTSWNFDFPTLQQAASTTWDMRFSDLFKLGTDHTFRLSTEYKYNEANGQFLSGSKDYYSIYSGGVMWDWEIVHALSLNNAVRHDHLALGFSGAVLPDTHLTAEDFNRRSIDATSFNSGLIYRIATADTLRVMVGRGFQLPSLDVLGMQIPVGGGAVFTGDPNTRATAVTNYELDYDRGVAPLEATLRLAVFHQTNQNLFNFLIVAPSQLAPFSLESTNTGNSDEDGFEFTLKGDPAAAFRWNLNYRYSKISDDTHSDAGIVLAEPFSVYKDGTPKHVVNAGLGYSIGSWELDARGGWRSRYQDWQFSNATFVYSPVTTKPYVTIDSRIGYKLADSLAIGVTIDQLTRAYTFERGSGIPIERRIFVSASYHV